MLYSCTNMTTVGVKGLKTDSDWLSSTVPGSEFQTRGAERQKPRPARTVVEQGRLSSGLADN